MPPLFREQHIEKRSVRRARGLDRTFVHLAVLVHRADDIAVGPDDLFRLFVRYLERLDDEVGSVGVAEHDVENGIAAHIRILIGRGEVDLYLSAAHDSLNEVVVVRLAVVLEGFFLYIELLIGLRFLFCHLDLKFLLLIFTSALGDLPRFLFRLTFRERLFVLVDAAMVGLALQVSRTDARLVVGELPAFLGAVLVDFCLALVRIALGALGRDVPAAIIVFAVVAGRRFPGAAVSGHL